jgi:WD40 repeat protein
VQFSPDGTRLAIGAWDGAVSVWSVKDGAFVREQKHATGYGTRSLQWTADGTTLAFCPGLLTETRYGAGLLDMRTGQPQRIPTRDTTQAVAISRDGRRLAAVSFSELLLWERQDGGEFLLKTTLPFADVHPSLKFSPDGQQLAILCESMTPQGSGLQIWDLRQNPPTMRSIPDGISASIRGQSLDWSPDGNKLVGRASRDMRVWDVLTDPARVVSLGPLPDYVRFSPDGQHILASGDRSVSVFGTLGLHPFHTWQFPGSVLDVTYHPSGEFVAVANGNGTVYVLRVLEAAR